MQCRNKIKKQEEPIRVFISIRKLKPAASIQTVKKNIKKCTERQKTLLKHSLKNDTDEDDVQTSKYVGVL